MKKLKITKKNVLAIGKGTAMLLGALSTATVAGLLIKNIIPMENASRLNRAMIIFGTALIGSAIGGVGSDAAAELFDAFITAPVMSISEAIEAMKLAIEKEEQEYRDIEDPMFAVE